MEPYQQLEREWAEFNEVDPAGMVACSSGTAALHLSLESLRLPPLSECLVPDLTMIACPRAVTLAGLTPVFVDCDERLNIDCNLLPPLVYKHHTEVQPLAVMPVHIYGRRCNMDAVQDYARQWVGPPVLKVIEDLAEAHGVRPHPCIDAACWSFYKNKIVAGEEGGAVWFRDLEHAKLARQLRSLGFTDAHDFMHVPRGHNYRMSNAHAEIVLKNLRLYVAGVGTKSLAARREVEGWYEKHCPADWRMSPRDAPWVYDFRAPGMTKGQQTAVVRELNDAGLAARFCFQPMHRQEEYRDCRRVRGLGQGSITAAREVIYMPISPGIVTEATAEAAFRVIRDVLAPVPF